MNRIICALLLLGISGCGSDEDCSGVYTLEESGRYEAHMRVAKAWPLCPTESVEKEKYRFVWLRSTHNPIVISLDRDPARIELMAVRLDGIGGGNYTGDVTEMRTTLLSQEDLNRFKSLLQEADFWNLKSLREVSGNPGDGTRWVLEGAIHDKAHAVDRGSHDVQGPFREAALFLLEKSQINPNGDIY